MSIPVTIVIVARDRFSSLPACVTAILAHTDVAYKLLILDFGYARSDLDAVRRLCAERQVEIIPVGRTIPMVAFAQVLPRIDTPFTAWVDNDTYVAEGWLSTLLDRAARGERVILPVTFEREGLDIDPRKIPLRNHVSHAELRKVSVNGRTLVFDHKPFRRAAPEELPQEPHVVDFFELHAFFAETAVLRQLDYPPMVVREHIDLGLQLHKLGIPIWGEPKSHVIFDNIHERPTRQDLAFFFFRWQDKFINQAHDLFEQRWGWRFYNEQFMQNWAFRRRVYSVCRYLAVPQKPADLASRVLVKLFRPAIPPALRADPLKVSERVLTPLVPSPGPAA
jgi:glycosyl transferase family 2